MEEKRKKYKICITCNKEFFFFVIRGRDRKTCSIKCRKEHIKKTNQIRIEKALKCSNPACNRKANRIAAKLCETCYYRIRRNGTLEIKKPTYKWNHNGYIKTQDLSHPLAGLKGHIYEHRKIAYEKYKNIKNKKCYWCGILLKDWTEVVIDHLDNNKRNNEPENLLLSCNKCNRARGAMLRFLLSLNSKSLKTFITFIYTYRKSHSKKTVRETNEPLH